MNHDIEILGTIVPDSAVWLRGYMAAGRRSMTAPIDVEQAVAALPTDRDVTLFIDSPGGATAAGASMISALTDWQTKTGHAVDVVIGGCAMSMAAVIAISLGGRLLMHGPSVIMFHAASVDPGGSMTAGELRDYADCLDVANRYTVNAIARRAGISTAQAKKWIEGKTQTFIGTPEAVSALGAVAIDDPLPATDADTAPSAADLKNAPGGLAVACACAKAYRDYVKKPKGTPAMPNPDTPAAQQQTPSGAPSAQQQTPSGAPSAQQQTPSGAPSAQQQTASGALPENIQAAIDDAVVQAVAPLRQQLDDMTRQRDTLQSDLAAEKAKVAAMQTAASALGSAPATPSMPVPDTPAVVTAKWRGLVEECGGNIATAAAKNPDLYKAVSEIKY